LKKKKLIFILSSNYSGSHFLSLMLGGNSKAEHLGELKNLYKGKDEARCYVCDGLNCCSLFHGIDKLPKHSLYDELFSRLGSDIEVLVDASKKGKWFKDFVDDSRYDIRLIHLVRDPRALARRWLMLFEEKKIGLRERIKQCRRYPHKFLLFVFGDLLTVCIYKWVSQNKKIAKFVKKTGLPFKVISYREIALETDSILKDICDWVDLDYQPEQKSYWEFEHHGTQKYEYEWVRQQGGAKYFDQRWKEYLTQNQVQRIEKNHMIKRLLGRLSLRFIPEGLGPIAGVKGHNGLR
jgi:hypothetical protein